VTKTLNFGGCDFQAAGDAALYWPSQNMLLVADLHLEKASSYARHGQMLPPYDSLATLEELQRLVALTGARAVVCLGDNFHDSGGEARLTGQAADILRALTAQTDWTWITGNHDPVLEAQWGGTARQELQIDGIMLRHEAQAGDMMPEISGHYHPKLRVIIKRRHVVRRCLIVTGRKIIMPAFGALTGGMDAAEAAEIAQPGAIEAASAQGVLVLPSGFARFPLTPVKLDAPRTTPFPHVHALRPA
jgi:uncharacterized protein